MQMCLFILTSLFWTYAAYYLAKSIKSNVSDKVGDLVLAIFGTIGLFIMGLILYCTALNVDKEMKGPNDYYYNRYNQYNQNYYE